MTCANCSELPFDQKSFLFKQLAIMKLTFLGTGTSTGNPALLCSCATCLSKDPRDIRLRSSVLIEAAGTSLLIDCGPDFRQQALRANIRHIDAVLITHEHYDHMGGLDDLRPFCFFNEMPCMPHHASWNT